MKRFLRHLHGKRVVRFQLIKCNQITPPPANQPKSPSVANHNHIDLLTSSAFFNISAANESSGLSPSALWYPSMASSCRPYSKQNRQNKSPPQPLPQVTRTTDICAQWQPKKRRCLVYLRPHKSRAKVDRVGEVFAYSRLKRVQHDHRQKPTQPEP